MLTIFHIVIFVDCCRCSTKIKNNKKDFYIYVLFRGVTYIFFYFQLNVSYPATGCQKLFEISDEHKLRIFYEKRMGAEVEADSLGDEWKGYVVRISGGNDKQGFPMKQGVLTNGKVSILYVLKLYASAQRSYMYACTSKSYENNHTFAKNLYTCRRIYYFTTHRNIMYRIILTF